MFKPEHTDKNIRDIIEGPPRMESQKSFEEQERIDQNNMHQEDEKLTVAKQILQITPEQAHKIALGLLNNTDFLHQLKNKIAEKIVRNENVTRLDLLIKESIALDSLNIYGLTKEHVADIHNGNFMLFDLVPDGEDLAISFKKATGNKGIRPLDNIVLAEMLNKIFMLNPKFVEDQNLQENISPK